MEARRRIRQWRAGRCLGRRLRRLGGLAFLGRILILLGLGRLGRRLLGLGDRGAKGLDVPSRLCMIKGGAWTLTLLKQLLLPGESRRYRFDFLGRWWVLLLRLGFRLLAVRLPRLCQ